LPCCPAAVFLRRFFVLSEKTGAFFSCPSLALKKSVAFFFAAPKKVAYPRVVCFLLRPSLCAKKSVAFFLPRWAVGSKNWRVFAPGLGWALGFSPGFFARLGEKSVYFFSTFRKKLGNFYEICSKNGLKSGLAVAWRWPGGPCWPVAPGVVGWPSWVAAAPAAGRVSRLARSALFAHLDF
jgi:hypothetical protein